MGSFEFQQVKRRIGTIRQIRKVTSAMQRVAAARLILDRRLLDNARRYGARLRDTLREVVAAAGATGHPLLRPGIPGKPWRLIALGAERGLCGGYHVALSEKLAAFRAGLSADLEAVVVGKILLRRVRRAGVRVVEFLPQPPRERRAEVIRRVAVHAMNDFGAGNISAAVLLYSRFESARRQTPVTETLLPLSSEGLASSDWLEFEPEAPLLLERLVPEAVLQQVDEALLNSVASENAARQEAMARAAENAGEMLADLIGRYRRLRQERITDEMLELVGGCLGREKES